MKLKVQAAADHTGLSKSTLDKYRIYGGGPAFLKMGKRVAYDTDDLNAWLATKRVAATGKRGAPVCL